MHKHYEPKFHYHYYETMNVAGSFHVNVAMECFFETGKLWTWTIIVPSPSFSVASPARCINHFCLPYHSKFKLFLDLGLKLQLASEWWHRLHEIVGTFRLLQTSPQIVLPLFLFLPLILFFALFDYFTSALTKCFACRKNSTPFVLSLVLEY